MLTKKTTMRSRGRASQPREQPVRAPEMEMGLLNSGKVKVKVKVIVAGAWREGGRRRRWGLRGNYHPPGQGGGLDFTPRLLGGARRGAHAGVT